MSHDQKKILNPAETIRISEKQIIRRSIQKGSPTEGWILKKSAVNWATFFFVKLKYFSLTNAMKFSWNWFPENKVKFISSSYREMHMHTTLYMYIFLWRFRCKSCIIMILNFFREINFTKISLQYCEKQYFYFREKN